MRIVFMGTPEFALPALQTLIQSPQHEVVAVYSQPPRRAGRGQKERPSPIHQLALEHEIPVCTPLTLKEPDIQKAFVAWKADVAVVTAYGLLLPKVILEAFPYGCVNIHPSLLPRWRGAAPIQRTIMAGDTETGVAIMQMDEGLDTGDVLALEKMPVPEACTAGQLHDAMAKHGAELLTQVLGSLENITAIPQLEDGITYAAKVHKSDGKINWNQPTDTIGCLIRGLSPWPGAFFDYEGEKIKISEANTVMNPENIAPGTVFYINRTLTIACSEGAIQPLKMQRPGKKAMKTEDLLRGFTIENGTKL